MNNTTKQAAKVLGITPKALRRFIRRHGEMLKLQVIAGQYLLSEEAILTIESTMNMGKKSPEYFEDRESMFTVSDVRKSHQPGYESLRANILAERQRRADALQTLIRQARERGDFVKPSERQAVAAAEQLERFEAYADGCPLHGDN